MFEDSEDNPKYVSKWDVFALFAHLFAEVSVAIVHFAAGLTEVLLHKADVVEQDKLFHEDVTRTIETITRGE